MYKVSLSREKLEEGNEGHMRRSMKRESIVLMARGGLECAK